MKTLIQSRTFWLNVIVLIYVLATKDTAGLSHFHANDHVVIAVQSIVNILLRMLTKDEIVSLT